MQFSIHGWEEGCSCGCLLGSTVVLRAAFSTHHRISSEMLLRALALRTTLRQGRSYQPISRNAAIFSQLRAFHATRPMAAGLTNILEDRDSPPPPVQVKRITDDGVELMDGRPTNTT